MALRRFALLVFALVLCAPAMLAAPPGARAQDGSGWQVESIAPLSDLVPQASRFAFPAPDAVHVAVIIPDGESNLACAFNLDTETSVCVPLPEEIGRGFVMGSLPPVVWAPDSQRLAVVGLPLQFFVDNDLTVVDFAAQTATVLAPDETTGALPLGEPGDAIIDVQPAWSPDGSRIAVERTQWGDEDRIGRIAIIDAATGEEVSSLEQPVLSSEGFNFGVTMALDWSPDGASLAFGRYEPGPAAAKSGVWLFDVDPSAEAPFTAPREILSLADAEALMQTAPQGIAVLSGFVWSPDGAAALVWVHNPYEGEQRALLYNAADGTLGALPRPDGIAETDSDMMAAWSPNGSAIIVASVVEEADPAKLLVEDVQSERSVGLWLVDRAAGASQLLGYVPFMPVPTTRGAWNEDGDVLLGGYRLHIAQN